MIFYYEIWQLIGIGFTVWFWAFFFGPFTFRNNYPELTIEVCVEEYLRVMNELTYGEDINILNEGMIDFLMFEGRVKPKFFYPMFQSLELLFEERKRELCQ